MKRAIITGLVGMLAYASALAVEPVITVSKPANGNLPIGPGPVQSQFSIFNNAEIRRANEAVEKMKAETDKMVANYQRRTNPGKVEISKKVVQRPAQTPVVQSQIQNTGTAQTPVYRPQAVQQKVEDYSKLEKQLIRHEGYKTSLYYDQYGRPHVGIGFNLTRPDARKRLAEVGANYEDVMKGKQLNGEQVMKLFKKDLAKSVYEAKSLIGSSQPKEVIDIFANMVYNMGIGKVDDFKSTLKYVKAGNYRAAADRMKASDWYKQVPSRAKELTNEMRNLSVKYPVKKSQTASNKSYRRGR